MRGRHISTSAHTITSCTMPGMVATIQKATILGRKMSSVLDLRWVLAFQQRPQSQGSGGWGEIAKSVVTFGSALGPRVSKSLKSHMEVLGAKCRTVDTFGLALCFRGGGVVVANCGAVVTVGGVWGLGVDAKSVRNVRKRSPCFCKRPRPKIVAKRKTSQNHRHFWPRIGSSRLKKSTVTGIPKVPAAKR